MSKNFILKLPLNVLLQDDGEKVGLGERFGFRVNGPGKQVW